MVTYRAIIHGTASTTATELISQIEQWTAQGSIVTVQRVVLTVDGSCTVALSSFADDECQARNVDLAGLSSTATGVIGGVVAMVILSIALVFVIIVVTVLIKRQINKPGTTQPSSPIDQKRYKFN